MKLGLILECGPDGADKKVCEYVVHRVNDIIEIESVTLGDKKTLIENCGLAAAQLLRDGCHRVVIVWDLYPPWEEDRKSANCVDDCNQVRTSLAAAGVTSARVHLVCVIKMLEAWLLADGHALSSVLSRPAHRVTIRHTKRTEEIKDPKARLKRLFKQTRGYEYEDRTDAIRIIQALPNFNQVRRCPTFSRFVLKATGVTL
jgi:hypothetical protein